MIAIEMIEKLKKEELASITVLSGEDFGQYGQMKKLFFNKIGFEPSDLNFSYFDMSETSYQDAEMDLESLPFFADEKIVIFDNFADITTDKKTFLNNNELKRFEAYLGNPLFSTKLVICASGKLDGKRRLVKLLKRDAQLFEAKVLKETELRTYFQKRVTYAYNLRSWLTGISGTCFTQNLYYNTGVGTAKYNGSISSMTWKSGNESTVRGYKFTYDGLDRVLNATYGETASISTNANRFSENVTGYDKNGNIKSLQRYGQTGASAYGLIDNLTFTLNGNQLSRVDDAVMASAYGGGFEFKDGVKQVGEYTYDANGNLTKDLNKGITDIQYNCLNLPSAVTFSDGSTITYVYAADGTKLRTVHKIGGATTTTDYCGNVVYENGAQKLLITEEGYITLSDNKYYYYLKDHQGNNRVVINQSGAVEETNHYYLFGGVFASSTSTQPYKYNSKEYDTKKGLNWYDYGARHYDAVLGRFMTVDPLAEKYYSESLYTYCYSNPINCIDPNGKDGIYIAFPDYKISTPIGKIGNLGHAGVLLIDNKTGVTKYYEYGRYDKEGKGVVRTFAVPNVKIGQDKKPTLESLNKTLSIISEQAGHAGRIEGAYIESDKFKEMKNYAESKIAENANSKRKEYSLRNNNCGTFAADVLKQDPSVKDKAPVIIDPRPNSIVKEYQDNFKSLNYDPKKRQVKIE